MVPKTEKMDNKIDAASVGNWSLKVMIESVISPIRLFLCKSASPLLTIEKRQNEGQKKQRLKSKQLELKIQTTAAVICNCEFPFNH